MKQDRFVDDSMETGEIIKIPEREVANNKKINRVLEEKTILYQTARPGCLVRYNLTASGKEITVTMFCTGEVCHIAKKIIHYDRPILEAIWKDGHINKSWPLVSKAIVNISPSYEEFITPMLPILHLRLEPLKSTPRPDTYLFACLIMCPSQDGIIVDLRHSPTPKLTVHRMFETEIEEIKAKKGK